MYNPFEFCEPVTGDHFLSRDNEISETIASAKAHKNVVIYGERQIGKSSLLAETARRNSKDFTFVKVEAAALADEQHFLDCFTREIIRAGVGKAWRIEPALWDLLTTRRMRTALSPGGIPAIADKIRGNVPDEAADRRQDGALPDPQEEQAVKMCSKCGRPLKWIEKYKRYFCYSCKKYAPRERKTVGAVPKTWGSLDMPNSCPDCRSSMRYMHRYSEYYCPKCATYPLAKRRGASDPWPRDDMMEALDLPQKLSELKGKPVLVMIDDVQELADIGDGRILDAMRLKFEEHEDATYVFAGIRNDSMHVMFDDSDGAFYKFAKAMELGRIPDPEMGRFLMSRFRSGGGKLSDSAADRIVGIAEGMPKYAQQIGHELFHVSQTPQMSDVEDAIARTVRQQAQVYSLMWESIRSPLQKRYLFAVAREPGVPHGEAFIRRYGLKSRSHVQRTESQLEGRGIIGHGEILDPMLVLWLRQSSVV